MSARRDLASTAPTRRAAGRPVGPPDGTPWTRGMPLFPPGGHPQHDCERIPDSRVLAENFPAAPARLSPRCCYRCLRDEVVIASGGVEVIASGGVELAQKPT